MRSPRTVTYIAVTCILGAVLATCLGTNYQIDPREINEQVHTLQQDQDNTITKQALIGPFIGTEVQEPIILVTADESESSKLHTTPDPAHAEATLADLHSSLEFLQNQHAEAQAELNAKQQQLHVAGLTAVEAHSATDGAMEQLSSLTAALHESLNVFRQAGETSRLADAKLEEQKQQAERARSWLRSVEFKLQEITTDYRATKTAAEIAARSAQEAQHIAYGGASDEAGAETLA